MIYNEFKNEYIRVEKKVGLGLENFSDRVSGRKKSGVRVTRDSTGVYLKITCIKLRKKTKKSIVIIQINV